MPQVGYSVNFVGHLFRQGGEYILCIRVVSSTQFDGMILSGARAGELVTDILFSSCINLGKIDYAKALPIVTEDTPIPDTKINYLSNLGKVFEYRGEIILVTKEHINNPSKVNGIVLIGKSLGSDRFGIPLKECKYIGNPFPPTAISSSKPTQPVEDIAEIVNVGLRMTGDSSSLRVISNIIRIYEACKDNPNYSVKELVKDIKD